MHVQLRRPIGCVHFVEVANLKYCGLWMQILPMLTHLARSHAISP